MGPKSLTHGGRSGVVAHYARTVGVVLVRARILPGLEVRVDLGVRELAADRDLDLLDPLGLADDLLQERPVDPGAGEEAWSRNRNGHTVIIAGAR